MGEIIEKYRIMMKNVTNLMITQNKQKSYAPIVNFFRHMFPAFSGALSLKVLCCPRHKNNTDSCPQSKIKVIDKVNVLC